MNEREIIINVLNKVLIEHGYANLIMRRDLNVLSDTQKKFASACIYGTLRNYKKAYQWAKPFIKTKCNKKTEIIIVCATYQLKYMNCKDYVVVDQMVQLAKPAYRQFVNAILHKVIESKQIDYQSNDELEILAIDSSLPLWLIKMWIKQYGKDIAMQLIHNSNSDAIVFGRINTLVDNDLINDNKVEMINDISFIYHGNLLDSKYYHLGQIVIQDSASCWIVKQFDYTGINKMLDCCAAPGSKTSQMAMYMGSIGQIDAYEIHKHRCELLKETIERCQIENVQVINNDILQADIAPQSYDAILLDAPCSGLGVLDRRVEIRYFIEPDVLDQCQQTQLKMLDHIADILKINGQLIYSTCTMNKKENEKQIESFLQRHPNYQLIKQENIINVSQSYDCFYYAYLRRVA